MHIRNSLALEYFFCCLYVSLQMNYFRNALDLFVWRMVWNPASVFQRRATLKRKRASCAVNFQEIINRVVLHSTGTTCLTTYLTCILNRELPAMITADIVTSFKCAEKSILRDHWPHFGNCF